MSRHARSAYALLTLTLLALLLAPSYAQAYTLPPPDQLQPVLQTLAIVGGLFLSVLMWPIYKVQQWLRGSKPAATETPAEAVAPAPTETAIQPSPTPEEAITQKS